LILLNLLPSRSLDLLGKLFSQQGNGLLVELGKQTNNLLAKS
jgi:hypothetical protein